MLNRLNRIAVSGKSGCGNTTVSGLLAHTLGIQLVNYTFRNLANDEGLSFDEVCKEAESDSKWDKMVDKRQVELANQKPSVLASRLSIWLWKEAELRVYLYAPLEIRAGRVHEREGGTLEAVLEKTRHRDARDHARYLSLYNINNNEYAFADLIIDVSAVQPEQIVAEILNHMEKKS